jgi:polysaccharide biosynthesis protein PslH
VKILIVTPYLPWPLNSGGNAAQFATLKALGADHDFTVLAPVWNVDQVAAAECLAAELPGVNVRAIRCGQANAPKHGIMRKALCGIGRRWQDRLRVQPNAALASVPVYPFYPQPESVITAIHEELAHNPDIVQCEFAETMPIGASIPARVPRVFVHHQIHSVYAERFMSIHGRNAYAEYLCARMRTEEIAHLKAFDAVIAFSETDRKVLTSWVGVDRVFCSPFPVPTDIAAPDYVPGFKGVFTFIGSEEHAPNRDALEWLLSDIWPRIAAALPDAKLLVVGAWSQTWRARPPGNRVEFVGFVRNLAPTLHGSVMLVPLRIGSGIRTKIITGFASATPVISTTVGCEGLAVRPGVDLVVADAAEAFAQAALRIARDREAFTALVSSGQHVAHRDYAPAEVRRRRNDIYAAVVAARRAATT